MAKRKIKRKVRQSIHLKRRKELLLRRFWIILALCFALFTTGYLLKNKIAFYYAMYFNKFEHKKLKNNKRETARINRILSENTNKTFGIDISHYQRNEDIKWDSLSIGNRTIPIKFVVMRSTMGNKSTDRNFKTFWKKAKEHHIVRGAYHFYRADEDPVFQANNFLAQVKLESGDLPPILDIEKIPRLKSKETMITDLKIWCKIVEKTYGKKPIIYTYYHYYKDYIKGEFEDYPIWIANYNDVPTPTPEDDWDFWQFTENGIVYGINTKVDVDIYNGSLWSLKRMTLD